MILMNVSKAGNDFHSVHTLVGERRAQGYVHTRGGKHGRERVLHFIYKVQYDGLYSTRHLVANDRFVQGVFCNKCARRGVL